MAPNPSSSHLQPNLPQASNVRTCLNILPFVQTVEEYLQSFAGRGGEVDRLEGQLAEALAAESRARAELIEERSSRVSEVGSLTAAVEAAGQRNAELQSRLNNVEEENEKLLQEQDVRPSLLNLISNYKKSDRSCSYQKDSVLHINAFPPCLQALLSVSDLILF